jgi:hypothetical protein
MHCTQKKDHPPKDDGGLANEIWGGLRQRQLTEKMGKKKSPSGTQNNSELTNKD